MNSVIFHELQQLKKVLSDKDRFMCRVAERFGLHAAKEAVHKAVAQSYKDINLTSVYGSLALATVWEKLTDADWMDADNNLNKEYLGYRTQWLDQLIASYEVQYA